MLHIRKAMPQDMDAILHIYRAAQDYMIANGNPHQWGRSYPNKARVEADLALGCCHVVCEGTEIRGVFALCVGAEPSYQRIAGAWRNAAAYLTLHRVASDGRARGVFACAVDYCKGLASNIRIDTHADNHIMQKLLIEQGFVYCGIIQLADGAPRRAYHWVSGA